MLKSLSCLLLVCLAGCAAKSGPVPGADLDLPTLDLSAKLKSHDLRPYVGQRIVATGLWDKGGKGGAYLHGKDRLVGEVIYIESTTDRGVELDNALYKKFKNGDAVQVTGTLHLYENPPVLQEDLSVQRAPTHFFFDVEEAVVKTIPAGK